LERTDVGASASKVRRYKVSEIRQKELSEAGAWPGHCCVLLVCNELLLATAREYEIL
jgi:hypothetical protein